MRSFPKRSLMLLAASHLAACAGFSSASVARERSADLVLTNGRVYTVDTGQPWAEAVAIRDGKIVAVGKSAAVNKLRGPGTRVVDLQGRLLLPAFGDAHIHPVFGGMSFSRCSLHKGNSVEDYKKLIAACVAATPGTSPIYGVGWGDAHFPPNGIPHKDVLDSVSKDRALIFRSVGGHTAWVNSKALELAGITKDTPDPANGVINRDPKTGEPIGSLQETAQELIDKLVPPPSSADVQGSIVYTAKLLNSLGITSWHDAGIDLAPDGSSDTLAAYKAVHDRGELSSHVTIAFKWDNARKAEQIPTILAASARAKGWGLNANHVKFYLDGVIPQKTAAMIEPYEHTHERGPIQIEPDVLNAAVTRLDAKGIQAHAHAIGDRGSRIALDAFQASAARNGKTNRPMISHMNVIDPADQRRFGKLGVIAVFQPTWAANYPYMDLTKQAIGPVRSTYIYPARGVLKNGGKIAYGSDWPVGTADPIMGLQVAVTRIDYLNPTSEALLPEEGITLEQAIQAYTINVAYANKLEKVTGSIARGKSADLVLLDQNIFTLAPKDISKAKVVLTLFQGKEVYGALNSLDAAVR